MGTLIQFSGPLSAGWLLFIAMAALGSENERWDERPIAVAGRTAVVQAGEGIEIGNGDAKGLVLCRSQLMGGPPISWTPIECIAIQHGTTPTPGTRSTTPRQAAIPALVLTAFGVRMTQRCTPLGREDQPGTSTVRV